MFCIRPLGFSSNRGGQLVAIAGAKEFPLPPAKDYVWLQELNGFDKAAWNASMGGMVVLEVIALPVELPMLLLHLGPGC